VCVGGRLVAEFELGGMKRPDVPDEVGAHLTTTTEGLWVLWAHKVARGVLGDRFVPMNHGAAYPADAVAECRGPGGHRAPDRNCRCGFHAVAGSDTPGLPYGSDGLALTVILSGRILAFEWEIGALLCRAERQTVIKVGSKARPDQVVRRPDDPDGRLAVVASAPPAGSGPVRLALPADQPPAITSWDDAGFCATLTATPELALI
jgi:hypothetical protein